MNAIQEGRSTNRRIELEEIIKILEDKKIHLGSEISKLREQLETCLRSQEHITTGNKLVALTPAITTDKPFFFHKDNNSDVKLVAATVHGLYDALEKAEIESIEFHLYREDFERWLIDVFQAYTLASRMAEVRLKALRGEQLRSELRATLK